MDNNETLKDIEAKMREDARRVDAGMTSPNWAALLRDYADRIGAAIKRDAKEVCRETLKVANIVDAIHRFCKPEPLNTAAVRKALEDTLYLAKKYVAQSPATRAVIFDNGKPVREIDYLQAVKNAEAALSAPARNCDVGTAEEQAARLRQYCLDKDSLDCRHYCMQSPKAFGCSMEWAQMPYEEGGAE